MFALTNSSGAAAGAQPGGSGEGPSPAAAKRILQRWAQQNPKVNWENMSNNHTGEPIDTTT